MGQHCCDRVLGVDALTSKDLLPSQDQKRMEKISKRVNAIEEVNNNVKLLTEMVTNYSKGETTESNEDLMKVRRGLGLAGMSDRYPPEFLLPVLHHS